MSKDNKQELRQDTKKDNLVPTNAELGILKVLWKHGPRRSDLSMTRSTRKMKWVIRQL
jgi:hypothetical protein